MLLGLKRAREGLCVLIRDEVLSTDDPHILFRGNSLTTKIVDQYMRLVGQDYLYITVSPLIKAVLQCKESCEIDPTREPLDAIRKNIKRLIGFVTLFWDTIQKSAHNFPVNIVEIFAYIKEVVSNKFNNRTHRGEHVRYPAIR